MMYHGPETGRRTAARIPRPWARCPSGTRPPLIHHVISFCTTGQSSRTSEHECHNGGSHPTRGLRTRTDPRSRASVGDRTRNARPEWGRDRAAFLGLRTGRKRLSRRSRTLPNGQQRHEGGRLRRPDADQARLGCEPGSPLSVYLEPRRAHTERDWSGRRVELRDTVFRPRNAESVPELLCGRPYLPGADPDIQSDGPRGRPVVRLE